MRAPSIWPGGDGDRPEGAPSGSRLRRRGSAAEARRIANRPKPHIELAFLVERLIRWYDGRPVGVRR